MGYIQGAQEMPSGLQVGVEVWEDRVGVREVAVVWHTLLC